MWRLRVPKERRCSAHTFSKCAARLSAPWSPGKAIRMRSVGVQSNDASASATAAACEKESESERLGYRNDDTMLRRYDDMLI